MDKVEKMPQAFMSANWFKENAMKTLFVAGLEAGVRGFDTAREYKVESEIGRSLKYALKKTGIKREDIFVQTRISNEEVISGRIAEHVRKSLRNIDLGYLDCFMFHWPTPDYLKQSWAKLVDYANSNDIVRSIGICNCRLRHLKNLKEWFPSDMPQIVQIEIQPFWQANDVVDFCHENGILLQAFSPLCKMIAPIKDSPILNEIAAKYNKSIPQIILKWHQQRGISPISLTSKVERIQQNFCLSDFHLDEADMNKISSLDCGYKYHLESATCVGF